MKFLFSAGIVVYFQRKEKIEYLLLHYEEGHWDFSKGKIEKGETKVQAAMRELQEETGLQVKLDEGFERSFEYFFKAEGQLIKKKVYFFTGKSRSKQVKLSSEHIDFAWLAFDQAHQKLTHKNAKNLLQEVSAFLRAKKG